MAASAEKASVAAAMGKQTLAEVATAVGPTAFRQPPPGKPVTPTKEQGKTHSSLQTPGSDETAAKLAEQGPLQSNYRIAMPVPSSLPKKDSSVDTRIQAMDVYLTNASRLMSEHPHNGLKVFSAPEYVFDRPIAPRPGILRHRDVDVRQLLEEHYHEIDNAMRELSKKHPDMVIKVPISWSKPAERPSTEEQYLASKGASDPAHPLHDHYVGQWAGKKMGAGSRREKAQDASNLGLSTFGEMHQHDFPKIGADTTHLARNTVLTYFNGERISKYHKIMGMQEVCGADEGQSVQFFPGTDYGGRHQLPNGEAATQEICRDHAVNTASSAGDIHFVHSDGVRPSAAPGKYDRTSIVVHANTVKSAGDFFNPVETQRVEMIQPAANGKGISRVSLTPDATRDGVELYNIDKTKRER